MYLFFLAEHAMIVYIFKITEVDVFNQLPFLLLYIKFTLTVMNNYFIKFIGFTGSLSFVIPK